MACCDATRQPAMPHFSFRMRKEASLVTCLIV